MIFKKLLLAHPGNYDQIPGLLINKDQCAIDTGNNIRIDDLDQLPSPYLTGLFDQIMRDHPEVSWSATLETNRGCPYACTFCDWGSLTYNKVKKFGLERVFAELDWIGRHCDYVSVADANFGMFEERDSLIVDKLIEVQQKRLPKTLNFTITWAKNQKNTVANMARKLIENSTTPGQGLFVSVQSMDIDVLENIKRKNLDQHKIQEIFALCDRNNVPVYTELILGLPGDTVDKWKENFYSLFRSGNHSGIAFYQAQLLENAEMNLLQKKLWKLQSRPMYDYMNNSYTSDGIDESVQVIVATRDIPYESMLDCLTWSTFIHTMHVSGMTTYVSRYFYKAYQIDYAVFYEGLYEYLKEDTWWKQELDATRSYYQEWFENGRVAHPKIEGIEILGWNLYSRLIVLLHYQDRIDHFYDLLKRYLSARWPIPLLQNLLAFQRQTIVEYKDLAIYPIVRENDFNFYGYLVNDEDLEVRCKYQYDTLENKQMNHSIFLQQFHYGRKRNFGKTRITRI